jgi:DNA-binding XRE family transcriptional regulator
MKELKDRVLQRRKVLDLTQQQLAKKVGVKQQSIQQLEDGLVKRPRYLLELSVALECDASWLVSGKGTADFSLSGRPYTPGLDSPPAGIPPEFTALLSKASPRSHKQLLRILEAAADGRLSEADINLINQIVERIATKE